MYEIYLRVVKRQIDIKQTVMSQNYTYEHN